MNLALIFVRAFSFITNITLECVYIVYFILKIYSLSYSKIPLLVSCFHAISKFDHKFFLQCEIKIMTLKINYKYLLVNLYLQSFETNFFFYFERKDLRKFQIRFLDPYLRNEIFRIHVYYELNLQILNYQKVIFKLEPSRYSIFDFSLPISFSKLYILITYFILSKI